ncbi:protein NETWORKED 2B [Raphanus sativus]|uniref:Protein NETWORKED 2B n=1 Tax=Raphanus sativus TaxID=3726 RepID=A0A6J0MIZ5_RAPSA|nr:protein NETWORKED 2B [Raphanus sativus]
MLQRAASNAYSWWWASHIRTKQSKWLEHNLQDMEEKVHYTLKIINEDGDTFAIRAEMYYRKRPEIVNFVEEAFRSYRALAERYDHLSTELQSANHMIATAFPEHVPFPLDDDDDNHDKPPKPLHLIPGGTNIPEVPEIPKKEFKSQSLMLRKGPGDMKGSVSSCAVVSSGLSKEEALEEIDRIHKGILVLQTEKEFVRSSYEQAYERYWNLENEVTEMQKRVVSLQDEFGVGAEIEDGEAKTLVARTALTSCKETIAKLEETQKRFAEDAETEKERIVSATERFEALRNKFEMVNKEEAKKDSSGQESKKESREVDLDENLLSNGEFAEKIDELVEKVVSLETTASSHTALVKTLRSDTDELHEHIRVVEEDKACLVSDSIDMKKRITALEDELSKVRDLFQRVEEQNNDLQKHLTDANSTAKHLSGKLQEVKMEDPPTKELDSISEDAEIIIKSEDEVKEAIVVNQETVKEEKPETKDSETESTCFGTEGEDEEERRNWRQLLPEDGKEDREKVLLDEYTSVLRDYREVKRKLGEVEKKNRDGFFELALQLRELKNAVSCEDVAFHFLPQKPESMSISHSSNSSISMASHDQQVGDVKGTPQRTKEEEGVKVKFAVTDETPRKKIPTVEEKVRGDIDAVLEENIEFWLRFSTSVHQIQKYQTAVHDLKAELSKLSSNASEAKPIYRHLREIRTELQLWLENSAVLRDELEGRYETLCNIRDEVTRMTSQSGGTKVNDSTEISSYQAAKFHGEILNMKQENKRVFNELQGGLERAKTLRTDVERVVCKLEEGLGISNAAATRSLSKNTSSSSSSSSPRKPRIPLRSFLFGVKLKKYKQQKQPSSIFACVSPSPALHKQCSYIVPPEKLPRSP